MWFSGVSVGGRSHALYKNRDCVKYNVGMGNADADDMGHEDRDRAVIQINRVLMKGK